MIIPFMSSFPTLFDAISSKFQKKFVPLSTSTIFAIIKKRTSIIAKTSVTYIFRTNFDLSKKIK